MDDFQSYLDMKLTKVDFQAIKRADGEVYEYNVDKEIRELVVRTRDHAGFTQKQLAERCGMTQANISNIEKGITKPTIDSLKKIADATGKRLIIEFVDREGMF